MEDEKEINRLLRLRPLTDKQLQVIQLSAQGLAGKEIAALLRIGIKSVISRKKQACQKLGAKNTPHAVWIAAKRGLLG
jgi:DNA-binding CsgD family transcriptional regulator